MRDSRTMTTPKMFSLSLRGSAGHRSTHAASKTFLVKTQEILQNGAGQ